jgi:hypothetical protein
MANTAYSTRYARSVRGSYSHPNFTVTVFVSV